MSKYLFFDVDGTLLPFGQNATESTRLALKKAHERGHRLFLSTGRSPVELDPRLNEFPFDGGVFAGGSISIVNGERIYERFFSTSQVEQVLALAEKEDWHLLMQTDTGTFLTKEAQDVLYGMFLRYNGRLLVIENIFTVEKLEVLTNVTKMIFITKKHDVKRVREALRGSFDIIDNTMGVPLDDCAEIVLPGINKATGMMAILKHCNVPIEASMAFGDGANDIEIVRDSGIGVAMGNGSDDIKKVAKYITGEVDKSGIYDALKHFGVID